MMSKYWPSVLTTLVLCLTLFLSGVATVDAASSGRKLFGVQVSLYETDPVRDIPAARELGAQRAKIYLDPAQVEDRRGRLSLSSVKREIKLMKENGLEPLVTVSGGSRYSCSIPRLPSSRLGMCPPDPYKFSLFMSKLVTKLKSSVKYWEIWSEQDAKATWYPKPNPVAYARVLKASYDAIKKADPRAKVLFGGPISWDGFQFTGKALRSLKGAKAFDIIGFHPYRIPESPSEPSLIRLEDKQQVSVTTKEEILLYKAVFAKYGYGSKPLWLTEVGWGTNDVGQSACDPETFSSLLNTPDQQADYVRQLYTTVRDDPELQFVQAIFWFFLRDTNISSADASSECPFGSFGLLRKDFSLKPAALAFQELSQQ